MKRLHILPRADRDIDEIFAFLVRDSRSIAVRFLDALEQSFRLIRQQPGIGSRRWTHLPVLKTMRIWGVTGFRKHLIFYHIHENHIEIVRILHTARDIPAVFGEAED